MVGQTLHQFFGANFFFRIFEERGKGDQIRRRNLFPVHFYRLLFPRILPSISIFVFRSPLPLSPCPPPSPFPSLSSPSSVPVHLLPSSPFPTLSDLSLPLPLSPSTPSFRFLSLSFPLSLSSPSPPSLSSLFRYIFLSLYVPLPLPFHAQSFPRLCPPHTLSFIFSTSLHKQPKIHNSSHASQ